MAAILTGVVIAVSLLVTGCSNVVAPSFPQPGGKGTVLVSFSAGRAALSPVEMDFDVYEFIFHKAGDGTSEAFSKNKNELFTFTLELNKEYTLEVKAYKDSIGAENLAATGVSGSFTVSSSTKVNVKLTGLMSGGPGGTFSFDIKYPDGAHIEELVLIGEEETGLTDGAALTSDGELWEIRGSVDVEAGWYFLIVRLEGSDGSRAGYANGVAIYSGQTTHYGSETEPVVFEAEDFKAQPEDPNAPEQVLEWHGFNVAGESHYFNNDRTSAEFDEESNYDRSRAIGYRYQNFKDSNEDTWHDVLKVVPPTEKYPEQYLYFNDYSGYEEFTVALTYNLVNSGNYKLSMWFMVEGGVETPAFCWVNTGGEDGDLYASTGDPEYEPFEPWREMLGSRSYVIAQRDTWYYLEKTFTVWGNDEIGLLTRELNNSAGIKDATLYIRDVQLDYNGKPVVDTTSDVKITPASFSLIQGKTRQLSANMEVYWSSNNGSVATVDADGLVTAVSVGTAIITAASKEDSANSATASVKVIEPGTRYIALTFDDGPDGYWTPLFMDVLAQYGASATFFQIGGKVDGPSGISAATAAAGHEVGNHSWSHSNIWNMSTQAVVDNELIPTQQTIFNATGAYPKVYRTPVLWYTDDAEESGQPMAYSGGRLHGWEKQYGRYIEEAARKAGLALIDATLHQINDFDTDPSIYNIPGSLLPWIIDHNLAQDWGILLLHDGAGVSGTTWPALPLILEYLQEEGFEVLSVSQLVEKRRAAAGISWELEPGHIYYGFQELPRHVKRITIEKDSSAVSWFEEDNDNYQGNITIGMDQPVSLTAQVTTKGNGTCDPELYWYSDDKNIVTVNESTGVLNAVGWGSTTIRAVAGGKVALLTVTVNTEPVDVNTIASWAEFEEAGSIPGVGDPANIGGEYPGSGASYEIDSFYGYDNVLKLVPPAEGYPRAGIALTYDVPYSGRYTFTMDVYVESAREDVTILWYDCTKFQQGGIIFQYDNLPPGEWVTNITGSLVIGKDATTGLLTRRYEDDTGDSIFGLRNTTIYIKNFKLELEGIEDPLIEIEAPVTTEAPVNKTITLEWAKDGRLISEDSLTITLGQSVTLTTKAVFPNYEWRVDGWEVEGNNAPGFIFDSTGKKAKTYNISLWVDGNVAGDAVEITVVEAK